MGRKSEVRKCRQKDLKMLRALLSICWIIKQLSCSILRNIVYRLRPRRLSIRRYSARFRYYSFKIFPRFGLVETTRIIHHNQLLFTKFGKNLRHIQSMTSKVEPAANYSTVDVKMTSKVEPAADYSTLDRKNLGTRL